MFKRFLDHLQQQVENKEANYLLTVSGGVDSVVLVDLFLRAKLNFSIAHCNFNLRGKESDGDQRLVEALAREKGIPLFVKSFDTKGEVGVQPESTQMVARRIRYAWFNELCEKYSFKYVVTAHHSDDNTETVLLNITRGTGVQGLVGMDAVKGNLCRPLLPFTKNEIINYALKHTLNWREDSSNASTKYKRNNVRLQLIPHFETLNPNFRNTFAENIEKWRLLNNAVQFEVEQLKSILNTAASTFVIPEALMKAEEKQYFLFELLKEYGFTFDQFQSMIKTTHSGKQWYTPKVTAIYNRGEFWVQHSVEKKEFHTIQIKEEGVFKLLDEQLQVRFSEEFEIIKGNPKIAQVDKSAIEFPLSVRTWEQGDFFYPLGMKGKKKVSDFMIDQKIPLNLKDEVKVILTAKNEIVWVIGFRIDNRFKIRPSTSEIITLEIQD